jgi:phosphoglycerol transferase MdoB-like AlkP superfamily enzyme
MKVPPRYRIESQQIESLEYLWKYVDNSTSRIPKNRMYIGWMDSTSHTPFILPPFWKNNKTYFHDEDAWASVNGYLNTVRWTDDIVRDIILGFRERGLEEETLFVLYSTHSHTLLTIGTETMRFHLSETG